MTFFEGVEGLLVFDFDGLFFGVALFLGWFEFESFERADACSVMLTPISSIILVNSLTFDSKSMVGGEAANRVGSGFFKPQRR